MRSRNGARTLQSRSGLLADVTTDQALSWRPYAYVSNRKGGRVVKSESTLSHSVNKMQKTMLPQAEIALLNHLDKPTLCEP